MTAAADAPEGLDHCLAGLLAVRECLRDLGVTVTYEDLDQAAVFDADTHSLAVANDIPVQSKVRIMIETWYLLTMGPEWVAGATHDPRRLHVVPPPRAAI